MALFQELKRRFWKPKEQRKMLFNLGLLAGWVLGGYFLFILGLREGRLDPTAPVQFDSPDLQTLTASSFIALGGFLEFTGFRLGFYCFKVLADGLAGPSLLVGYVTTREITQRKRNFGRWQLQYRLYLVSRQAFASWLKGPDPHSPANLFSPQTRRVLQVTPRVMAVPAWAYDLVREGDLVGIQYARWQKEVQKIKVIESVLPPFPREKFVPYKPPAAEEASWRLIEDESPEG